MFVLPVRSPVNEAAQWIVYVLLEVHIPQLAIADSTDV